MRLSRFFLAGFLITLVAGVVIAGVMLVNPSLRWSVSTYELLVGTLFAVMGYCIVSFAGAVAYENGRQARLARSGLVLGSLSVIAWMAVLWLELWRETRVLDWFDVLVPPTAWACFSAVVGSLMLLRLRSRWLHQLRRIAIIIATMFLLALCAAVWVSPNGGRASASLVGVWGQVDTEVVLQSEFANLPFGAACSMLGVAALLLPAGVRLWHRIVRLTAATVLLLLGGFSMFYALTSDWPPLAALRTTSWGYTSSWERDVAAFLASASALLALLTLCAILITITGALMERLSGRRGPESSAIGFWLTCPRCGREQTATTGTHACTRCRLLIHVELT